MHCMQLLIFSSSFFFTCTAEKYFDYSESSKNLTQTCFPIHYSDFAVPNIGLKSMHIYKMIIQKKKYKTHQAQNPGLLLNVSSNLHVLHLSCGVGEHLNPDIMQISSFEA